MNLMIQMFACYVRRWSDRNSKGKISVNVAFPQHLDVKKFCHPDVVFDCSLYNLSAVVVHHGRGFGSGHYTTYCWNSDASKFLFYIVFNSACHIWLLVLLGFTAVKI